MEALESQKIPPQEIIDRYKNPLYTLEIAELRNALKRFMRNHLNHSIEVYRSGKPVDAHFLMESLWYEVSSICKDAKADFQGFVKEQRYENFNKLFLTDNFFKE